MDQRPSDSLERADRQDKNGKSKTKNIKTFKDQHIFLTNTSKSESEPKYSSLPLNLESVETTLPISSSQNVAIAPLMRSSSKDLTFRNRGENLSDLSSWTADDQTDDTCLDDIIQTPGSISEKETKTVKKNLEQMNTQLPVSPAHNDIESEVEKQNQSNEGYERVLQSVSDKKCFKIDLEAQSVKEYNEILENSTISESTKSIKSIGETNKALEKDKGEHLDKLEATVGTPSHTEYSEICNTMNNQNSNTSITNLKSKEIKVYKNVSQAGLHLHRLKQEKNRNNACNDPNMLNKDTNENTDSDNGTNKNMGSQNQFDFETYFTEEDKVERHWLESKFSQLKVAAKPYNNQTGDTDGNIEDTMEPSMTNMSETNLAPQSDKQNKSDSFRARPNTKTIIKCDSSETGNTDITQTDILHKNIVFVAEKNTIHIYKLAKQTDKTECNKQGENKNKEEDDVHSHDIDTGQDQSDQDCGDKHKIQSQKGQRVFCPSCNAYHGPSFITKLPIETFLQSFEGDIISSLGNSPEDDTNLCDNLLPAQIRYMSLLRQTSGSKSMLALDLETLKALKTDYLEKMINECYRTHTENEEMEYHETETEVKAEVCSRSESSEKKSYNSKAVEDNDQTLTTKLDKNETSMEHLPKQVPCPADKHLTGSLEYKVEQDADFFQFKTESVDSFKAQQPVKKKTESEIQPKQRPTLEDIVEKQNLSEEAMEKEENQTEAMDKEKTLTALETLNAAIEAGLLFPSTYKSAKTSSPEKFMSDSTQDLQMLRWIETMLRARKDLDNAKNSNDPKQYLSAYLEYVKMANECKTWLSSLGLSVKPEEKGQDGSSDEVKKSESKDALTQSGRLSDSTQVLQIFKWMETMLRASKDLDIAKNSDDPIQSLSVYLEYVKKAKECETWLSSLGISLMPEEIGQKGSSDEVKKSESKDALTQSGRNQKENSRPAEVINKLADQLTEQQSSSSITFDKESVVSQLHEELSTQSEDVQRTQLYDTVKTLLSALSSIETQYEHSLGGNFSSLSSTSPQLKETVNSTSHGERLKKPFTDKLIKKSCKVDDKSKKVINSPRVRNSMNRSYIKKNKNELPIKTPKPRIEQDRAVEIDRKQIESDKSWSETLTESSDDYFKSDHLETHHSSGTWQLNPVYNTYSQGRDTNEIKNPSAHDKGTSKRTSGKGDFQDLRDVKDTTLTSKYGKPVSLDEQLEAVAKAMGMTVYHVPSDGNCMFSAIVDQLKLLGNFKYTPQTLRSKAVQYLRDNPIREDGTPLECFLSCESWESYLYRMAQENTWGDHLMLNGIAELLQCKISIATVTKEQACTNEIEPAHCDPKVTLTIGLKGESHFESLRLLDWEERLIQLAKEPPTKKPKTKQEKKKPQLAFAAMLAEGRHPMKSHSDKSEQETNTSDEEMDLQVMEQYNPLWLMSDTYLWDPISNCSTLHLSYILRLLYNADHILNREPLHFQYEEQSDKSDFGEYYLVGPTFQGTEAYISRSVSRCGHCCNSVHVTACDCTKTLDWNRYFCMKDTVVTSSDCKTPRDTDLIKDETTSPLGYLKLVPVNETSFSTQLVPSQDGKKYLKQLKPVEHKVYVQSKYKSSYPYKRKKSDFCKSEDIIVFQTEWPRVASEWIDRHRPSGWPDKSCIKECIKMGCFVVPARETTGLATIEHADSETLWQYSFLGVQSYLLRHCLVKDQLHTFCIFKVLLDECINCLDVLTTEVLTQVFLHAGEEIPPATWWKNSSACILFMVDYLQHRIESRHIPNYFISAQNMVNPTNEQRLSILSDRLQAFRHFPLVYMLTCAEKHHLGVYRLNETVQKAIQDMQIFRKHKKIVTVVKDTFTCLSIGLASSWINNNHHYDLGYCKIVAAYEEWGRGLEYGLDHIPFDSFISQIVSSNLSMQDQWMFVFFTKEKYSVQYQPDIFGYTSCHMLKDIIGESAGRFGDAVIPDCLSALGFEFLQKFINLLYLHLHFYEDAIPVTEYTIQQYGDKLIELSNEDIQKCNSEGSNPNYQLQLKQYDHNRAIFDLYCILFNCYRNSDQTELFLQYLPEAETVCVKIYEEYEYKRLENICKSLNLSEKVTEIQEKIKQLREETDYMDQLDQ